MERQRQDLQRPNLYDNYTISVSPPPGAATAPVSPARGGASGYENLTSPTRSTPPPPPVASRPPAAAPMAKPVPGKQGYVLSPFSPDAGYIDVSGMPPGTEAKDPYTGKVFRVP